MNNKQKLCASKLPRRDFASALGVSALGAAAMPFSGCATSIPFADITPYSASGTGKRWFKGNTHLHTLRSDGEAFPVEAAALFKREGYDLYCEIPITISEATLGAEIGSYP